MKNKNQVFILGASSNIGMNIMKIYMKNRHNILAHYNRGNKEFFNFTKQNRIKIIKFNFLTTNKKIENFFNKKLFSKYNILINSLAYFEKISFLKTNVKNLEKAMKVNFYSSLVSTQIIGNQMNKNRWGRIVNLGCSIKNSSEDDKRFSFLFSKFLLEFFPEKTKTWIKNNVLINTLRAEYLNGNLSLNKETDNIYSQKNSEEQIAEFVYFLGSNQNTYISNQVLSCSDLRRYI